MHEVRYRIRNLKYYSRNQWSLGSDSGRGWRTIRKKGSKILLFFSIIDFDFTHELFWKNMDKKNESNFSLVTDYVKVEQQ